jgi:paraquat-inducible protein B
MSTATKKNDNIFKIPLTKINPNSVRNDLKTRLTFPRLLSENNLDSQDSGFSLKEKSISEDDCFEKLKNIRSNISNLRKTVSSYSKIYDNISNQIENGITNLPKEEILLIENKKLKKENLFYQNENQKLKNRISELENQSENVIFNYKNKYLKEIKELEKIFEDTLKVKNKEIDKLQTNQELLLKKIEEIKETFTKEKEELIKHNEEIVSSNLELQRQIGNLYYSKWNSKLSHYNKKFHFAKKNQRKRTEDLETVIEEDKSDCCVKKEIKKCLSVKNNKNNLDINELL